MPVPQPTAQIRRRAERYLAQGALATASYNFARDVYLCACGRVRREVAEAHAMEHLVAEAMALEEAEIPDPGLLEQFRDVGDARLRLIAAYLDGELSREVLSP